MEPAETGCDVASVRALEISRAYYPGRRSFQVCRVVGGRAAVASDAVDQRVRMTLCLPNVPAITVSTDPQFIHRALRRFDARRLTSAQDAVALEQHSLIDRSRVEPIALLHRS